MPPTLDTTIAGSTANSYVTVAEADEIAETLSDVDASAWAASDAPRKILLLVRAARLLDIRVEWVGSRSTTTQAREHPRVHVTRPGGLGYGLGTWQATYDATEIAPAVRVAQTTLAAYLATFVASAADPFGPSGTVNLSSLSVGPINLQFRPDAVSSDGDNFFDETITPLLLTAGLIRRSSRLTR
jgi:hypothetical protein